MINSCEFVVAPLLKAFFLELFPFSLFLSDVLWGHVVVFAALGRP